MFEVKGNITTKPICPFCVDEIETFDHIFQCPDRFFCPKPIRSMAPEKLNREEDIDILNFTDRFLLKYVKYREVIMKLGRLYYHFIMHIVLDVVILFRFPLLFNVF